MIDLTKKYRCRNPRFTIVGDLHYNEAAGEYPITAVVTSDMVSEWVVFTREGKSFYSDHDLIPIELEPNQPIKVSMNLYDWHIRHFYKMEADGKVCTYPNGKTSYTTTEKELGTPIPWTHWTPL